MIKALSVNEDLVIKGKFVTALTDYDFAVQNLVTLMDKLDIQRKLQNTRFYKRLEYDLVKGCIMPPITIAFVSDRSQSDDSEIESYINKNIQDAFILDGIQRLNTLQRVHMNNSGLELERPLFLNVIICPSMDNLLYRMITLNNGQKPMSARHQIEILTTNLYTFDNLTLKWRTEKEKGERDAFNKSDLVKSYIAFLSGSTNIDNQKIIEEKMDELIAEKILHSNITEDGLEFTSVLKLISTLTENSFLLNWFKVANNLIGFSVGIRNSYDVMENAYVEDIIESIIVMESAFSSFDVSRIKLGMQRRKVVAYFIANFEELRDKEVNELLDVLSEVD